MKPRLSLTLAILVLTVACSNQEQTLRPYSALARSQVLDLTTDGYLIAVEKFPRMEIGAPPKGDTSGYRTLEQGKPFTDTRRRHAEFANAMDDPKTMLITHVVSYFPHSPDADSLRARTFLYNAYNQQDWRPTEDLVGSCREPCVRTCQRELEHNCRGDCERDRIQACEGLCERDCAAFASGLYDAGFDALAELLEDLTARLQSAADARRRYTHLFVMSMGWVNDQHESAFRFNRIARLVADQAKSTGAGEYRPMVIGLTWPSGWLGVESSVIKKTLIGHLGSYVVKANDADEVGYTVANRLINDELPRAREALGGAVVFPKVVLIGHSFGDRILTRALFSKEHLPDPPSTSPLDLYLGLQGAFSARRFVPGEGGEGAPYADVAGLGVRVVLTTSRRDRGNPSAVWSKHVGGGNALKFMCRHRDQFNVIAWPAEGRRAARAIAERPVEKVVVLNATDIVSDHNDVLDEAMAELIWCAIQPVDADGRVSASCADPSHRATTQIAGADPSVTEEKACPW